MANIFKSYTKASVGISTTDVYTVPLSTTSVVIGFVLSNTTPNTVYGNVLVNKANVSYDDVYLIKNIVLYEGSSYEFSSGNKIILETGDKIQVSSTSSSSIDVIISVLEQTT